MCGKIHLRALLKSKQLLGFFKKMFIIERAWSDAQLGNLSREEKKQLLFILHYREAVVDSFEDITFEHPVYPLNSNEGSGWRWAPAYFGEIPLRIEKGSLTDWAKHSSVKHEDGIFLYLLTSRLHCTRVLELGTGLGISTLYLLKGIEKGNTSFLDTIERWEVLIVHHKDIFSQFNTKTRYRLIHAKLEDAVLKLLKKNRYDFVFYDAELKGNAMRLNVEMIFPFLPQGAIVVIDDIYWSAQVEAGWEELTKMKTVVYSASISLPNRKIPRFGLLVKG